MVLSLVAVFSLFPFLLSKHLSKWMSTKNTFSVFGLGNRNVPKSNPLMSNFVFATSRITAHLNWRSDSIKVGEAFPEKLFHLFIVQMGQTPMPKLISTLIFGGNNFLIMYIQGGFFNCSSQFSVPKWKTLGSQSEILFHEILDVQKILVGWTTFIFLALKFGRNS